MATVCVLRLQFETATLDPFRSSLSPIMVQKLVCAQDWLQALVPISFRKSKDEVEALEDEFHDLGNMLTSKLFVY